MSIDLASWRQAWRDAGAAASDESLHREVVACWSEPHRHYHTLQHLRECLDQFGAVRELAEHPGEVALALWFHDVFYEPRRDDNELRSADWARASLADAGAAIEVADRVHALIMQTRHKCAPQGADAQLLVDIDLAILGASPQRFDESDMQVRAEYAHVPQAGYCQGRRAILQGFLARPRLYSTDYFHSRLEQRARENLRRALARLGGAS
jgi:predicted metal-dependent HD superfamily phosphohydrolase